MGKHTRTHDSLADISSGESQEGRHQKVKSHQKAKKASQRGGGHRRHALIAAVAILIVLAGALIAWRLLSHTSAAVRLDISGYSVSEAEFSYALDAVRNDVIQETAQKGSSISKQYWASADANSPTAKAVDQAIAVLQRRYAVYGIAADSHIVDSPSWEALIARMNRENEAREQKISAGQVVYGTQNFTIATYLDSEMRSIKEAYTANASNPDMAPSEADIQRYYDEHDWTVSDDGARATLDQVRSNVLQEYRYERYDQLVEQRITEQSVSKDLEQLRAFASSYLSGAAGAR
ncbi:MAG: hypothetical protein PT944_02500 [Actinomycetaceae bacterium]|nr:hypothetical protein [Arcanobacterium sp.]MDD7686774.1 hypothetical protein [Actinomycetaceae bacterium]MDY5273045.1 hypothetical protein [Arcanobacterium sp.]